LTCREEGIASTGTRRKPVARRLLAVIVPAVLALSGPLAEAQTTVRIPDVVGKKKVKAVRIIHRADLDPRVTKRDSSKPAGTVLKQQPKAGRRVNEGRTVLLVVARSAGDGNGNCDPSYPDFCIPPPPPDLDCDQVNGSNFTVVGSDPHGFDGDNDGVGCET
jgi:hypothetical protein